MYFDFFLIAALMYTRGFQEKLAGAVIGYGSWVDWRSSKVTNVK